MVSTVNGVSGLLRLTTAAVDSGFSSRGVFATRAKGWAGAGVEDLES
jgi:hypothetical protein